VRSLVLHVGLPKTGTTTLQRDFFPRLPGYLGGTSSAVRTRAFFEFCALHEQHSERWSEQPWRDEVVAWWDHAFREHGSGRLFLSSELLYSWGQSHVGMMFGSQERPAGDLLPLLTFLRRLKGALEGEAAIKVVFTIRNQADFLPSLYAQVGMRRPDPSIADFEATVRHLAAARDPYLDWERHVRELHELFGPADVLITVYEDGLESVAHQIATFVDRAGVSLSGLGRHNVRSSGSDGWRIARPSTVRQILRVPALLWPASFAPGLRLQVKRALGLSYLEKTLKRLADRSERSGPAVIISVSDDLRCLIRASWGESNARLGDILGRDLRGLGY